jgi:hypothetical protein
MQFHITMRIAVFNSCEVFARDNQQARFFATFTDGTRPRRLIGLAFSARKLRQPWQGHMRRSTPDEDTPS